VSVHTCSTGGGGRDLHTNLSGLTCKMED